MKRKEYFQKHKKVFFYKIFDIYIFTGHFMLKVVFYFLFQREGLAVALGLILSHIFFTNNC